NHDQDRVNGAAPTTSLPRHPFKGYSTGREKHRIGWGQVIILSLQDNETDEHQQVSPTEDAIAATISIQKQPTQPTQPTREQDRIQRHRLIQDESDRPPHEISSRPADVAHQLQEREIVTDQPDQVGNKDEKGTKGPDPNPGVGEKAPLRREEQGDENGEGEKGGGIFIFHSESEKNAEAKPVTRIALVDRADHAPGAPEPNERLKCVHGQPMMHEKKNWGRNHRERGQRLGKSAATHFTGEFS